jgi:hypothetical protein
MQRLLAYQAHAADARRESGKATPTWIKPEGTVCGCKFYRKWLLPCLHYFQAAEDDPSILSLERWQGFASMFEELGLDVYLKTSTVMVEDPARNPHEQIVDRMREINEVYRDLAYELMEQVTGRRHATPSRVLPDRPGRHGAPERAAHTHARCRRRPRRCRRLVKKESALALAPSATVGLSLNRAVNARAGHSTHASGS